MAKKRSVDVGRDLTVVLHDDGRVSISTIYPGLRDPTSAIGAVRKQRKKILAEAKRKLRDLRDAERWLRNAQI